MTKFKCNCEQTKLDKHYLSYFCEIFMTWFFNLFYHFGFLTQLYTNNDNLQIALFSQKSKTFYTDFFKTLPFHVFEENVREWMKDIHRKLCKCPISQKSKSLILASLYSSFVNVDKTIRTIMYPRDFFFLFFLFTKKYHK